MATIPTTYQTATGSLTNTDLVLQVLEKLFANGYDALQAARDMYTASDTPISNFLTTEVFDLLDDLVFDGSGDNGEGYVHNLRKQIITELYDLKLYYPAGGATNAPTYPSDYDLTGVTLTDISINEWWIAHKAFTAFTDNFYRFKSAVDALTSILTPAELDTLYEAAFFDGSNGGALHQEREALVTTLAEIRLHVNAL